MDQGHLAVVIADVSGKGVPAALFMVIAKTLIKDHTQAGATPAEVFGEVNAHLREQRGRAVCHRMDGGSGNRHRAHGLCQCGP